MRPRGARLLRRAGAARLRRRRRRHRYLHEALVGRRRVDDGVHGLPAQRARRVLAGPAQDAAAAELVQAGAHVGDDVRGFAADGAAPLCARGHAGGSWGTGAARPRSWGPLRKGRGHGQWVAQGEEEGMARPLDKDTLPAPWVLSPTQREPGGHSSSWAGRMEKQEWRLWELLMATAHHRKKLHLLSFFIPFQFQPTSVRVGEEWVKHFTRGRDICLVRWEVEISVFELAVCWSIPKRFCRRLQLMASPLFKTAIIQKVSG